MGTYKSKYQLVLEDDQDFARFWANYPKRVAKKEARKAWAQLQPTTATVDLMVAALAWQTHQPEWTKEGGQFIPFPASWLRAERWTDEPPLAIGVPKRMQGLKDWYGQTG